jgi:hypothetical protein
MQLHMVCFLFLIIQELINQINYEFKRNKDFSVDKQIACSANYVYVKIFNEFFYI